VRERVFMTYAEGEGLESSGATRVALWEDAWQIIQANPLLGTGFNTYGYLNRVESYKDTHNLYLEILVETGIVGLLVFLWLLMKAYHQGHKLFRSSSDPFLASLGFAFAAYMVTVAVVNIFGDRWNYLEVSGYLWILLACVVRGHLLIQEAEEHQAPETSSPGLLVPAPDSVAIA